MFVRQNQQQFRNSNADVQIFSAKDDILAWNKPIGVSNIYIMLIGRGGNGDGTNGGASGNVTVWFGSAKNVPDVLYVNIGYNNGSIGTAIYITPNDSTPILKASSGNGVTGSTADTARQFGNMGFYQSVGGQSGTAGGMANSALTFLCGGAGLTGTVNYGYSTTATGYLLFQPIIVGVGSIANNSKTACGCGSGISGTGGPGLALIASW